MKTKLLETGSPEDVRVYLLKKFKKFNSVFYNGKTRKRKCILYYLAASSSNQAVVESVYFVTFRSIFPKSEAEQYRLQLERQANRVLHVERSEYVSRKASKIADAEELLRQLVKWKEEGEYQLGERFFNELRSAVGRYDPRLVNPTEFLTEAEISRVARLTGSFGKSGKELHAEFEGMIGIQQRAAISFEAYNPNWGTINAKLEEEFKLGIWGSGEAKAKMERLGFTAEAQLAVAIGAELNIDGSLTWKKGRAGLDLKGNCNVFVGAEGALSGKLSLSAKKGLEASFEARAFAGFRASATGTAEFNYDGKPLISATGTAEVSFGVGGTLAASIKAPIFGATEISFETNTTLGLGFGVSAETAIDFNGIYLAGAQQFRKLIYLPQLARGYRMDLMTSDAKNLHYLEKCIARIGEDIESMTDLVSSLERVPSEKQSLLMRVDEDDW
jgi:hypothetical protein